MSKQQSPLVGYGDYIHEDLHAIVRRAHRERAQALREFFAWLFSRRDSTAQKPKPQAHLKAWPAAGPVTTQICIH